MNVSNGSTRKGGSSVFFFTELTFFKAVLYSFAVFYVTLVSFVALAEPFMNLHCEIKETIAFPNPSYESNCQHHRYASLLGMSRQECSFGRRLVFSVLMGSLIGWERRQADRPAGIRTMSIVSLGSCLFTINSTFAFIDGPMTWDSSRVSAAIPSGVGFLGAGLIFKKEEKGDNGDSNHVVHGLTTAASLWLSAAVGIACGGELYFPASFGVALMMLMLRFAPRGGEDGSDDDNSQAPLEEAAGSPRQSYSSTDLSELAPLSLRSNKPQKTRQRKSLASVV